MPAHRLGGFGKNRMPGSRQRIEESGLSRRSAAGQELMVSGGMKFGLRQCLQFNARGNFNDDAHRLIRRHRVRASKETDGTLRIVGAAGIRAEQSARDGTGQQGQAGE